MPAGETIAPRRGPTHNMLGRRLLPQRKIERIALVALTVQLAGVGLDVVQVATRQLAVVVLGVVGLNVEIDRAIADVGQTLVENLLHILDLLDDMTRGAWLDRGGQDAQLAHCVVIAIGVVLSHFHRFELLQASLLRDLVLALVGIVFEVAYVGNITHVAHLVSLRFEVTEQQVEGDCGACVSQMRIAIYGGATDVQPYKWRVVGCELLFLARKSVVKHQLSFHNTFILNSFLCFELTHKSTHFARKNKIPHREVRDFARFYLFTNDFTLLSVLQGAFRPRLSAPRLSDRTPESRPRR